MNDAEVKKWFIKLLSDLAIVRGIVIEGERRNKLLGLIIEQKDDINFSLAYSWITKGDWTYKKNLQLELQDFYPSEGNLKSIGVKFYSESEYLLLQKKLSELRRENQKLYEENSKSFEEYRKSDVSKLNIRIAELELTGSLKDKKISNLQKRITELEKALQKERERAVKPV